MSAVDTMNEESYTALQHRVIEQSARIAKQDKELRRLKLQIAKFVDAFAVLRPIVNAIDGAAGRLTPGSAFTAADPQDTRAMREILAQAHLLKLTIPDFTNEQAVGDDGLIPVEGIERHA